MTLKNAHSITTLFHHKPGIYYGYIIVLICFIMLVFGWGLFYNYGIFFGSLEQTFGWSRALTSGALSLSVLVSGFSGIVAGRLSDRFGPKTVIIFCAVFLAAGYGLMATVQNAWQLYAIYGTFIAFGIGGFWSPQVSTIARWFKGRRGLMTGIVSGGIGFGTLVSPPLLTQLITAYDWRLTYIIIGSSILVIVVVAAQFIKYSPSPVGQSVVNTSERNKNPWPEVEGYSLPRAMRTWQFWMVAIIYLCFGLVQLTVMVHVVPYATGLGISAIAAAGILSVIGGVSLAARIIIGYIADHLNTKISIVICLAMMTTSSLVLLFSDSLWKLYLFAVLFGIGYGGLSCLQSLVAAELYGLAALGVLTAIFGFGFDIGGAIGPVLAGHLFDINRSYNWAFIICFIVALSALVIGIFLKPTKK